MKQITKSAFLITLLLNSIFAIAQGNDTLDIQKNEKGKVKFARFQANANSTRKMKNDTVFLKSILHAKNEDSFRKTKEDLDELGITHKKFQQYYKGLKVENSEFLIHGKDGNIEVINGDFIDIDISIIKPSFNENQALTKALAFVGSKKYKWEDTAMEKFVKENTNNPNASYYPKGELVISEDYLNNSHSWKLSWKFTISSMEPNNEQLIYVDANDGSIINNIPLVFDANVSCTSQTRYSGTQNIVGDSFAGGNRLQESRNGVSIQTLNLNSTYNYGSAVDFVNSSTSWNAGSWTNFNTDQSALDAHWGAEKVFDFWGTVFTRNSINGAGIRVLSYVHAGSNWANAQWVGGSNSNYMQYGDGNGMFNPLVSLDVSAHEFGHGITQFTANLTPGTQESGALNEGFSDIWGACVEHWAAPNKQTWLMGEEIFNAGIFSCIRDLQNPKSVTAGEGQHPDTYHGNFWDNNGEPHFNSTVLSHWFYLLSQGGSGTNDLGNSFTVSGIGIENAQKIAYRAEALYLNSSADYFAARNATIQAATDLLSSIPNAISEVTNSWHAVGVGNQFQYTISGSSQIICGQSSYTINNLPSGASVTWSSSPSNIVSCPSTGNPITVTKMGNGNVTLTAIVNSLYTATKNIWVGPLTTINGMNSVKKGGTRTYTLKDVSSQGITSFNWSADGGLIPYGSTTSSSFIAKATGCGDGNVSCTYSNSCGSGDAQLNVEIICVVPAFISVAPNPANDIVNLTILDNTLTNKENIIAEENSLDVPKPDITIVNSKSDVKYTGEYEIQIWNEYLGLVKHFKERNNPNLQISMNKLPKGMYYIHLIVSGEILQKQILWVR